MRLAIRPLAGSVAGLLLTTRRRGPAPLVGEGKKLCPIVSLKGISILAAEHRLFAPGAVANFPAHVFIPVITANCEDALAPYTALEVGQNKCGCDASFELRRTEGAWRGNSGLLRPSLRSSSPTLQGLAVIPVRAKDFSTARTLTHFKGRNMEKSPWVVFRENKKLVFAGSDTIGHEAEGRNWSIICPNSAKDGANALVGVRIPLSPSRTSRLGP